MMPSGFGIIVFVALATSLPSVNGGFWSGWSEEEPANCPHVDNVTHVCSTLESYNKTCITIKCCHELEDSEDYEEYEDESAEEDSGGMGHHGGHHDGQNGGQYWGCSLCISFRSCTWYKCFTACCEGYERVEGQCTNKTGNLQCENGGVLDYNWQGQYCKCPDGFRGRNCQIPICGCQNAGECEVKDGRPHCNCLEGYYGDRCQNINCTLDCYNGGLCYRSGGNEFCWCPEGYVGEQCQKKYTNPDTCPPPDQADDTCEYQCVSNDDCEEDEVCCKEGCSSVCRKPKPNFCEYQGESYAINATYSPDPCTNCTCTVSGDMVCYAISCAAPECLYGEPVVVPGQCCPSCPDKPNPPEIKNCPTSVLHVNVSSASDQETLNEKNTKITAYDSSGNKLQVKYRPEKIHHCHCAASLNSQSTVQAFAEDSYGGTTTCSFKVIVKDPYPPRFTYCPDDIRVSENDVVEWKHPISDDNVGISRETVPDRLSGEVFPVGTHVMTYQVWDHDGNTASCNFNVDVTRGPPIIEKCPNSVLRLNTSYYTDNVVLKELTTGIQAFDSEGNKIQVVYQPKTVYHCKCSDSLNREYTVHATATDDYGGSVSCVFKVTVTDIYLPYFSHCPRDVNITEGDPATWREPVYNDNVGIWRRNVNMENGHVYPVGKHIVTYDVEDYDKNKVSCRFNIFVAAAMPPKISNCPSSGLYLNVPATGDSVQLDYSSTSIEASDGDGNKLEVTYRPTSVRHCYCENSATNGTLVEASAKDDSGSSIVTCSFTVFVLDPVKPLVSTCPENIFTTDKEVVLWQEPKFYDNVKVVKKSVTGRKRDTVFPVGDHTIVYEVWDYDGNYATCQFLVTVTKAKCTKGCLNGGVCYWNGNEQFCRCTPNFIGRLCEYKYNHPRTCPAPASSNGQCDLECIRDSDCSGASVCCKEGCSTVCRQPETIYCQYEGKRYMVNDTYSLDVCTTCTCRESGEMVCSSIKCEMPRCPGGRQPVSTPDHCCLTCPESKPRISCPAQTIHLNTSYYSNMTLLEDRLTSVTAFDALDKRLQVNYRPPFVHHCNCHNPLKHVTAVEAYAADSYGNVAKCSFNVVVRDIYPPVVFSCPEDVFVYEKEVVKWLQPKSTDNVGIAGTSCSSQKNGDVFPVGEHRISCDIWDYDKNTASCHFRVSVTRIDTPYEDIPIGLKERSTGKKKAKLHIIMPAIVGAVLLIILALVVFCCRRQCQTKLPKKKSLKHAQTNLPKKKSPKHAANTSENIYATPDDISSLKSSHKTKRPSVSTYSSSVSSRSMTGRPLAFHSNIYALPSDVGIRPPPYMAHPGYSPPPPYSVSNSMKDVTYLPLPLPAYHNPEYETLSVHSSSVFGQSVRSGSTIASRSSKQGGTVSSRYSKAGSVKSSKSSKSSSKA